jgi:hypothetical protein
VARREARPPRNVQGQLAEAAMPGRAGRTERLGGRPRPEFNRLAQTIHTISELRTLGIKKEDFWADLKTKIIPEPLGARLREYEHGRVVSDCLTTGPGANLIAAGLSPFAPEAQNVRAGRLLLERIRELAGEPVDFWFETTLLGRAYVKRLTGDSWSSNRLSSSGGSKHKRRRFMKKATDDPLTKLADAAFRQAARKVIKRAKEAGTTVVVWEDGEIKEVDPRKIKNGRRKR